MADSKIKTTINYLLRIAISGGLLFFVFRGINLNEMLELIKTTDINMLLLALAVFFIANFLILFRWILFVKALKLDVPFSTIVVYFFMGLFCNLFMPSAIGGDVIKAIGLCQHTPEKPKVFASILLDRLSGFAGIVILSLIVYGFGFKLFTDPSIILMVLGLGGLSIVVAAVLFNETMYRWAIVMFKPFPKIESSLMRMHYDIVLMKDNASYGWWAIAISVLTQVLVALMFYLSAVALHSQETFLYYLLFSPLVCVVSTLPSIGGLGVREAGWVYFLGMIGVDESIGVGIGLMSFGFMTILGLIGGVIYLWHCITSSTDTTLLNKTTA